MLQWGSVPQLSYGPWAWSSLGICHGWSPGRLRPQRQGSAQAQAIIVMLRRDRLSSLSDPFGLGFNRTPAQYRACPSGLRAGSLPSSSMHTAKLASPPEPFQGYTWTLAVAPRPGVLSPVSAWASPNRRRWLFLGPVGPDPPVPSCPLSMTRGCTRRLLATWLALRHSKTAS